MAGEWGMRKRRNGVEEQNPFTNMGRIIGRVNTGGANSQIIDDGLLTGIPDWNVTMIGAAPSAGFSVPQISVSGNVMSWSYSTAGTKVPCIIVYWVR